jgi:hypothetical protein
MRAMMFAAVMITAMLFGVSARTASAIAAASASVASSIAPAVSVVAGGLRKLALPKVIRSAGTPTSAISIASSSSDAADFSTIVSAWP